MCTEMFGLLSLYAQHTDIVYLTVFASQLRDLTLSDLLNRRTKVSSNTGHMWCCSRMTVYQDPPFVCQDAGYCGISRELSRGELRPRECHFAR